MARTQLTIKKENNLAAAILTLPYLFFITIFVIVPVLYALRMSFFNWGFYSESEFVGLSNFVLVIKDGKFADSILVACKYALFVVPTSMLFSFIIALLMHSFNGRISSLLKISVYIPNVVSGVIASCIFVFIFDYMNGFANVIMQALGRQPVAWLTTPGYAMAAIVIPTIWLGFGTTSLILLSGLNDIPTVYYEAASLDGAGPIKQLIFITLPSMKNVFGYVFITSCVGALQALDLPMLLTGGGPLNTTTTPNLLIYQHFKSDIKMGYTVAASMMLFSVVALGSAVIFKFIKSEKSVE